MSTQSTHVFLFLPATSFRVDSASWKKWSEMKCTMKRVGKRKRASACLQQCFMKNSRLIIIALSLAFSTWLLFFPLSHLMSNVKWVMQKSYNTFHISACKMNLHFLIVTRRMAEQVCRNKTLGKFKEHKHHLISYQMTIQHVFFILQFILHLYNRYNMPKSFPDSSF